MHVARGKSEITAAKSSPRVIARNTIATSAQERGCGAVSMAAAFHGRKPGHSQSEQRGGPGAKRQDDAGLAGACDVFLCPGRYVVDPPLGLGLGQTGARRDQ